MAVRMRLQRHGRTKRPYFFIVVTDSRVKRDGKFIEKLGHYDPTTIPADISLNSDRALDWLQQGAEPTDTVRAILGYKGVLYKKHLMRGVAKGAMTIEEADAKWQAWMDEKTRKVDEKRTQAAQAIRDEFEKVEKAARAKREKLQAEKSAAAALAIETAQRKARGETVAEEGEEDARPMTIDDVAAAAAAERGEAPTAKVEAPKADAPEAEAAVEEAPATEAEPEVKAPAEEAPVAEAEAEVEAPAVESPLEEAPVAEAETEVETPEAETEEAPAAETEATPEATNGASTEEPEEAPAEEKEEK